jgi:hypothetical protein
MFTFALWRKLLSSRNEFKRFAVGQLAAAIIEGRNRDITDCFDGPGRVHISDVPFSGPFSGPGCCSQDLTLMAKKLRKRYT